MFQKSKSSILISIGILIIASFVFVPSVLAEDNNSDQSVLPNFLQNFIENMSRIADETIVPIINKTGVGDIIAEPINTETNESFLQRIKDWMTQTSQKINEFFRVDIGVGFAKIIDLFNYGFNQAVEWVVNLFK